MLYLPSYIGTYTFINNWVARWYNYTQNPTILEGLGMENGIFYNHWGFLWPFGKFVLVWYNFLLPVSCTKKNLATPIYIVCSSLVPRQIL
jgi:hypothetical protein